MWWIKLTNFLFGWHYIAFQYGSSDIYLRIKIFPNGKKYVYAYGETLYLKQDGSFENRNGKWQPITWIQNE